MYSNSIEYFVNRMYFCHGVDPINYKYHLRNSRQFVDTVDALNNHKVALNIIRKIDDIK